MQTGAGAEGISIGLSRSPRRSNYYYNESSGVGLNAWSPVTYSKGAPRQGNQIRYQYRYTSE